MKTSVSCAGTARKNALFLALRLFYNDLVKKPKQQENTQEECLPLCLQRGTFVLGANDSPSVTPAAFGWH